MLTPIDDLDEINKALCQSSGWIALDLSNGNYLSRAAAAQNMYIFRVRNKMAIVVWADSDLEAVHRANYEL